MSSIIIAVMGGRSVDLEVDMCNINFQVDEDWQGAQGIQFIDLAFQCSSHLRSRQISFPLVNLGLKVKGSVSTSRSMLRSKRNRSAQQLVRNTKAIHQRTRLVPKFRTEYVHRFTDGLGFIAGDVVAFEVPARVPFDRMQSV